MRSCNGDDGGDGLGIDGRARSGVLDDNAHSQDNARGVVGDPDRNGRRYRASTAGETAPRMGDYKLARTTESRLDRYPNLETAHTRLRIELWTVSFQRRRVGDLAARLGNPLGPDRCHGGSNASDMASVCKDGVFLPRYL